MVDLAVAQIDVIERTLDDQIITELPFDPATYNDCAIQRETDGAFAVRYRRACVERSNGHGASRSLFDLLPHGGPVRPVTKPGCGKHHVELELGPDRAQVEAGDPVQAFGAQTIDPPQIRAGVIGAIAARVVRPSSQVVLLLGDGAAGFSLMDVDTLVRHDLPVVMVVGNNSGWGLERGPMQMLHGYEVATDLGASTRYDEIVRALGGAGELVTDPEQIGPALDRAYASGTMGFFERWSRKKAIHRRMKQSTPSKGANRENHSNGRS